MTTEDHVARARKAARRLARTSGRPYQTCLDLVARDAGRDHWGAFLADPVAMTATVAAVPSPTTEERTEAATSHDDAAGPDDERPTGEPRRPNRIGSLMARLAGGPGRGVERRSIARRLIVETGRAGRVHGPPLGTTVRGGRRLALGETIPLLALAPSGSGGCAAVVVPTVVGCDWHCLVVHCEAGLERMTSGHRTSLGPVVVLDLAGGRSSGSLDPLSRDWMPMDQAARASYVTTIARAVAPDDPDAATVITNAIRDLTSDGGGTTFRAVEDAIRASRGPDAARRLLSPLLDPATVSCMEGDGLRPRDLRGRTGNDGSLRPTTIYVVRGAAGADRQAIAASVLQEAIWWWALASRPGGTDFDGVRHGTIPLTVVLEDVHRLPPMPNLLNALERGAAVRIGHVVTAPSYAAATQAIGRTTASLESLFPVRIVLPQSDPATIERLRHGMTGISARDLVASDGTHLVVLRHECEPLRVRTSFFHGDPAMLARVHDPRLGTGPAPVPR